MVALGSSRGLVVLCQIIWLLGFSGFVAQVACGDTPPNVIVILADDMGYGDLSAYGNTRVSTPNMDSIAAHGARFTNGYVTAPLCSPTRPIM